jgi:pyruvate/2-oxoglutarate dehydrogenase complex dihydrolipoamide dehydrogenase (E3) component
MMPSDEDEPSTSSSSSVWQASPLATVEDIALAKSLSIWPLDEFNVELLNEVHPRNYVNPSASSSATASTTTQRDAPSSSSSMQQKHHQYYDLVVIGAGAGGLVSSRQAARRGASSCMISAELAGGDCLNAGCVPSKALLRCAKMIREVRKVLIQNKNSSNSKNEENEFGISIRHRTQQQFQHSPSTTSTLPDDADADAELDIELSINFAQIMRRMRKLRSQIAPIDGHARGISIGSHVYQGRGVFTSPTTIEVIPHGKALGEETNPVLHFRKAVIATGGRPYVPVAPSTNDDEATTATATTTTTTTTIPGLHSAPYTTNLNLFNLPTLPPRMIILGSGIVALEMAQAFATFGSHVTILSRSSRLFASSSSSRGRRSSIGAGGESDESDDAAQVLQHALEKEGVSFLWNVEVKEVKTLRYASEDDADAEEEREGEGDNLHHLLPLMQLSLTYNDDNETKDIELQCECLLLAMGRVANVQNMGLEDANVQYHPTDGILINDYAQSISNPNVYAVGDCVAHVPRLTHS